MKELAGFLFITPPSVTSLINNLVKQGMIKRAIDKKDRRILRLTITEKGKIILKIADQFLMKNIGENFKVLSCAEQSRLISIIEKILKNVVKLNSIHSIKK